MTTDKVKSVMNNTQLTLDDIVARLEGIKADGFVKTSRAHDTGVGKTLEDLLGIKENNLRLPDLGTVELKAKRLGSGSMLTLATKSPLPRGVNRQLFERYKYRDKSGEFALHSTLYGSHANPQGLRAVLVGDQIQINNPHNILAYWPLSVVDGTLKQKSERILLVFAETYGEPRTSTEGFHYVEAYLLSQFDSSRLQSALQHDKLKIDIRLGQYRSGVSKGKYHDHGTAFRIMKRDFLDLFANYRQLL